MSGENLRRRGRRVAAELYAARKGGGAFLNGHPIKVSGETDVTRARIGNARASSRVDRLGRDSREVLNIVPIAIVGARSSWLLEQRPKPMRKLVLPGFQGL